MNDKTDPVEQARALVRAAEHELEEAQSWREQAAGDVAELARHVATYDEDGHAWPVTADEEHSAAALRGLHVAAHRHLLGLYRDDVEALEYASEDLPDDQWAAEQLPEDDGWDLMYEAHLAHQMTLCGAQFATGPASDPYGTMCDKGLGHYPHTKHAGPDPMGQPDVRVEWHGGGTCAGDPLPYTSVEYNGGDA
jgi:hypothetical protein